MYTEVLTCAMPPDFAVNVICYGYGGTGSGIGHPKASTFITAAWWITSQLTESERTPFSRMSASVIGGPR
jgi:hypothetical protein